MLDTIPPWGHLSQSRVTLRPGGQYEVAVGTAEFGNGTTTVHQQVAASALGTNPACVTIIQSDADRTGCDTGAFGSTGTMVAGYGTQREALAEAILDRAAELAECGRQACPLGPDGVAVPGRSIGLDELGELSATGHSTGTPRSVAFNVQAFHLAVRRARGEIRILDSIHAADVGVVINPMQCRGRIEGGIAMALGAALFEAVNVDEAGTVMDRKFREYHIPAFADVPVTQVHFADTVDRLGPCGTKSMSESPFNLIAAALGNAIRDAIGHRFCQTPFKADRLYKFTAEGLAP